MTSLKRRRGTVKQCSPGDDLEAAQGTVKQCSPGEDLEAAQGTVNSAALVIISKRRRGPLAHPEAFIIGVYYSPGVFHQVPFVWCFIAWTLKENSAAPGATIFGVLL
ncbi:hypothetical protein Zmor_006275 [Zophobas morio]|uniref:Uncharacterized protein n=1 Tax=Zophobas morio TaxID=2755281 RepID=A0AA38MMW3_9CUCU|nr:hypothetical protein Zmor_006275 [Zophobas morio]